MYRIMYRFLVPGWSAKPLVSAHDRIMGTHRMERENPWSAPTTELWAPTRLNTMPRKLHDWHSAHSVYTALCRNDR